MKKSDTIEKTKIIKARKKRTFKTNYNKWEYLTREDLEFESSLARMGIP